MRKESSHWKSKLLISVIVFVLLTPFIAFADDAAYNARIEKLEAAVRALQKELKKLKAERPAKVPSLDARVLEELVDKKFEEKRDDFGAVPEWVQNMQWFGDFRFRFEHMDETDTVDNDQYRRLRIRARLGLKAKVNDEWDAIFRIATGNAGTTSTDETLGDAFANDPLDLDWAYAHWHPVSYPGLDVYAGKIKNPFYRAGKNQMIWDSDITPEGGAMSYNWAVNDAVQAFVNAGAFVIDDQSAGADASLFALQGYAKYKFDNNTKLKAGASLYCFTNIDDEARLGGTDSDHGRTFLGNTFNASNRYEYDYDIVEAFGEYAFHCGTMPVSIFGSYINNKAAPNTRNTGYFVGFKINKAKKPGSWQFSYDFRDMDPDATWAGMNDSDFLDGGTDGRGHKLSFKYQLAKNVATGLTYFYNDRHDLTNNRTDSFKRFQWDLIYKFK